MIELQFDAGVYAIETLQKAALKFSALGSFDFRLNERAIAVQLTLHAGITPSVEEFVARYRNEVLDQHLRAIVARETEAERNLILAYAFSNTKLVSST